MPKLSKVFRRFLISYILILIIPNLAGLLSYRTSISVTQSISIDNIITQLQKSQEVLDSRIAEVESFTRQIAVNKDLNVLINEPVAEGNPDTYGIWRISQEMQAFDQTNTFLHNFYVYLKNYNVIITPGEAYFRPEHYYQSSYYNGLTLEQWEQSILGKAHISEVMPLSPFVQNNKQSSVITFLQSLPLGAVGNSPAATIAVMIDDTAIAALMSGLEERYGGWSYISDSQGKTIFIQGMSEGDAAQMAADSRLNKLKVSQFYNSDLVITIRSETNGWIYRIGIPEHVLMKNADKIKHITLEFTVAALLFGLLTGLVLAYRNSAPINRLVGVMKEHFGKNEAAGRNEYDGLFGNTSDINTSNMQLELELNEQLPLARDAFLKRLIAGFSGTDEIGELGLHYRKLILTINELIQDQAARQAAGKEAELRAMKNQIDSHFLYNTLENVKMLAEIEGQFLISDIMTSLGGMMRYSMEWKQDHVMLNHEIQQVQHYVSVMNIRFDGRIDLRLSIAPECLKQESLKMSLQPAVENAIKHGTSRMHSSDGNLVITISAVRRDQACVIEITDNGCGIPEEKLALLNRMFRMEESAYQNARKLFVHRNNYDSNGIGLRNVDQRLLISYGTEYGIQIESQEGSYTRVIMTLPYRVMEEGG